MTPLRDEFDDADPVVIVGHAAYRLVCTQRMRFKDALMEIAYGTKTKSELQALARETLRPNRETNPLPPVDELI